MHRFFIAVLFSLTLSLGAQPYTGFVKEFGSATAYEEAASVRPMPDGYLVSAAYNYNGGAAHWTPWLLKLNLNGDTVATLRNLPLHGKMLQTNNGHLIFAGGNQANNVYDTVKITKTDTAYNTLWSTKLHFGACKTNLTAIIESGNGYIISGYYGQGNCLAPTFDGFVAALDTAGQLIWMADIDGRADEQIHDIKLLPDGRVVAFGFTSTETGPNQNEYLLVMLTANGKIDWRKQFGNEHNNFGYGIDLTPDGGLITNGYGEQMEIYKLDLNGNRLWHKTLVTTCGSTYFKVTATQDGGLAFLGTEDRNGQCNAVLIKTDSAGNIFWKHNWDARLRTFMEDSAGRFVLCGYANYLPDAVVILFDSTRLPETPVVTEPEDTTTSTDTLVNEPANPKDTDVQDYLDSLGIKTGIDEAAMDKLLKVSLFPNPATNIINIEISNAGKGGFQLEVYSMIGQLIYYAENIGEGTVSINISDIPNGTYTYKVGNKTEFSTGKFIIGR